MVEDENKPTIYKIKIMEHLKDQWADWLNGMVVSIARINDDSNYTAITVCVPDQSALRGILNKIWDMNLTLISVIWLDEENSTG